MNIALTAMEKLLKPLNELTLAGSNTFVDASTFIR